MPTHTYQGSTKCPICGTTGGVKRRSKIYNTIGYSKNSCDFNKGWQNKCSICNKKNVKENF